MKFDETDFHRKIRIVVTVISACLGILFTLSFMAFLAVSMWKGDEWLIEFAKENPNIAVMLPLAGVASYCVVTLLEYQSGSIKIEIGDKMKFEGASGTIVFWIATFLAIALAIRLVPGEL